MAEYCICNHPKKDHFKGILADMHGVKDCELCSHIYNGDCRCEDFKLDNLKLIEDLAKERRLV